MALLFSAVAGAIFVNLATANPAPLFYPRNPVISIESPTNRTYNVNSLPLKVTIETFNNYFEAAEGTITEGLVSYSLDGENSQLIGNTTFRGQSPMPAGYIPGEYTTFAASAFLTGLREGLHNLTVRANYDYIETYDRTQDEHRESESTVYFSIDTGVAEPFPTTLVITASGVSLVVVAAGVLVYWKKRKRQSE